MSNTFGTRAPSCEIRDDFRFSTMKLENRLLSEPYVNSKGADAQDIFMWNFYCIWDANFCDLFD